MAILRKVELKMVSRELDLHLRYANLNSVTLRKYSQPLITSVALRAFMYIKSVFKLQMMHGEVAQYKAASEQREGHEMSDMYFLGLVNCFVFPAPHIWV